MGFLHVAKLLPSCDDKSKLQNKVRRRRRGGGRREEVGEEGERKEEEGGRGKRKADNITVK